MFFAAEFLRKATDAQEIRAERKKREQRFSPSSDQEKVFLRRSELNLAKTALVRK